MTPIPELENMWREKELLDETIEETNDPFIPAKLAEPTAPEDVLIHIEL